MADLLVSFLIIGMKCVAKQLKKTVYFWLIIGGMVLHGRGVVAKGAVAAGM